EFGVMDHRGRTVWDPASSNVGRQAVMPIMWMSYGANSIAGLKHVKGNPILIAEAGKLGIFPKTLGSYPADNFAASGSRRSPLRCRHGSRSSDLRLSGADFTAPNSYVLGTMSPDLHYQPRERMNAGFYDGHVDRLCHAELTNQDSYLGNGMLRTSVI